MDTRVGRRRGLGLDTPEAWRLALVVVTLLAAAMRLYRLGAESLWYDEANTWLVIVAPLRLFRWLVVQTEVAPPLYFVTMWGWLRLAGDSEVALRLPSALFGTLSVATLGCLTSRLMGKAAGLAAAVLLALSPEHIWYSQETRNYGLFAFLVLMSTLALIHALRKGTRGAWLAYGLLALAVCYIHYYAFYFIAGQGAFVMIAAARQWKFGVARGRRQPWLAWLACMAAIVLLYLPWIPFMLQHRWANVDWVKTMWAGTPAWLQYWQTMRQLVLGRQFPNSGLGALLGNLLAVGLVGLGLWPRRQAQPPDLALIAAIAFVPPLLAVAVSQVKPSLVPRYLLPALPFVLALVARGAVRLRPAPLAKLLLALVAAGEILSLGRQIARPSRPDWRGLAAYVADHGQPGDGVTAEPDYWILSLEYYLRGRMPVVPNTESLNFTRLWLVGMAEAEGPVQRRLNARYVSAPALSFYLIRSLTVYQLAGVGSH